MGGKSEGKVIKGGLLNDRVAALFRHEDGQDDQLRQSAQAGDQFLVGCLWRLLASPQLGRVGPVLFPALLRHLRDADYQPTFLDPPCARTGRKDDSEQALAQGLGHDWVAGLSFSARLQSVHLEYREQYGFWI